MQSLPSTRPRLFQLSLRMLVLIVLCGAIGSYVGSEREREIRMLDHVGGEVRVFRSRLEVIRNINAKVEAFQDQIRDPMTRHEFSRQAGILGRYLHFARNPQEFSAIVGPSSPAAHKYEWPEKEKFEWRFVREDKTTYQAALSAVWSTGDATPVIRVYYKSKMSYLGMPVSYADTTFLTPHGETFRFDNEPVKTLAVHTAIGMGCGLVLCVLVRIISLLRTRRSMARERLQPTGLA